MMSTKPYSARLPDDLVEAAKVKGTELHLDSFSDRVKAGLELLVGWEMPAAYREALDRADRAEAQLARLRAERSGLRARLAGAAGVRIPRPDAAAGASKEDRLVAYLEATTPQSPATAPAAGDYSGYGAAYVTDLFTAMTRNGTMTRQAFGEFVPVPGRSVREGLAEVKAEAAAAKREARRAAQADGTTPEPSPAPGRGAEGRTGTQKGKSAARGKAGSAARPVSRPSVAAGKTSPAAVVQAAHPVTTASEVPSPVFKAGPDVDCTHPGFRGVKGVCPDCKQWVGGKR